MEASHLQVKSSGISQWGLSKGRGLPWNFAIHDERVFTTQYIPVDLAFQYAHSAGFISCWIHMVTNSGVFSFPLKDLHRTRSKAILILSLKNTD